MRRYNTLDRLLSKLDNHLASVFSDSVAIDSSYPAEHIEPRTLNSMESRRSCGYMRVNHAGEVAAQALYKAQAATSCNKTTRKMMQTAAKDEISHLNWCKRRLDELGGRTSYLNLIWFSGSFTIGLLAGLLGNRWNLGFVEETERQVVVHLDNHLQKLPERDARSRTIVKQMLMDESHHANMAKGAGATRLPAVIKKTMHLVSQVMVKTAYWI